MAAFLAVDRCTKVQKDQSKIVHILLVKANEDCFREVHLKDRDRQYIVDNSINLAEATTLSKVSSLFAVRR